MKTISLLLVALTTLATMPALAEETEPIGPDFRVEDIRISHDPSADPALGVTYRIEVAVKNAGNVAGAGFITVWAEAALVDTVRKTTVDRENVALASGEKAVVVFTWTPVGAGDAIIVAESFVEGDVKTSNDRRAEAFTHLLDGDGEGVFLR